MSDEDRIARVAHALCAADGKDPEVEVSVAVDTVDLGDGATWDREVTAPAWTTYASEARRMIAAVRTLGLVE